MKTKIKRNTKLAIAIAFLVGVVAGLINLFIQALLVAFFIWQIVDAIHHPGFWNYFSVALIGLIAVGSFRAPLKLSFS